MSTAAVSQPSMIIPCMQYDDAPAAIEWLCKAFGFKKKMVVPGENGLIMHAELTLGDGMIMMDSTGRGTQFDRLMSQPAAAGDRETQCPYVIVPDADAVYRTAKAAGADDD